MPPSSSPFLQPLFGHEKLGVYRKSIDFVDWADEQLEKIPKTLAVHSQLDRASTSIPLNIAEGNGKWSKRDRCRFFDIAWGSSLECAAAINVLVAKGEMGPETAWEGKKGLAEMVRMLVGLIKANDPDREFGEWGKAGPGSRLGEDGVEYGAGTGGVEGEE